MKIWYRRLLQLGQAAGAVILLTAGAAMAFDIPRIDGDDWDRAFRLELLAPVDTPLRAPEEFSASARLGWNDDGLRVRVTVVGTVRNESAKLNELWKGDSVEIYLSPAPDSPDRCQWVIAPGLDPRFPEPRWFLHDYRMAQRLKKLPAAVAATSRRTPTGYQLEVTLPWASLGIVPALGREVTCQIMVSNFLQDGQPQDHLVWYPMYGAYNDSRKMVRLRLAATAAAPVRVRGTSRVDLSEQRMTIAVLAPAALAGKTVSAGTLAAAPLAAGADGYAHAILSGPLPDLYEIPLEIDGDVVDVVPLRLPPAMSPSRRMTLETELKNGALDIAADCAVRRRVPGGTWETIAPDAPLPPGQLCEYAVSRPGDYSAVDYFFAGTAVPAVERRGTALLVVEQTAAKELAPEIQRLLMDWVGDGWEVGKQEVAAHQTPVEVKRLIQAHPADAVLLLGRVPVPYAGNFLPDGHPDHCGAWPADVFYATGDEGWTDTAVHQTDPQVNARQHNVPGDGKYDQNVIPGPVIRAVGRVDFHDMPVFGADESALLRRYLDRLHAYRQGTLAVEERGWVLNSFYGHPERFDYSGWQNLTTLLGAARVSDAKWPNFPRATQLWFAGCGSGGPDWMAGFGGTNELVNRPLNAVFTLLFGSYFGDWELPNNLMRGVLAAEGGALTCGWAGRPQWYVHPMGMGAPIGDGLRLTQNNGADGYLPTGAFARGVHIALLGDPTLRMHRVPPPTELRVGRRRRMSDLSWHPSVQSGVRYHVYRAAQALGPYERLTDTPIAACEYRDRHGAPGQHYLVRAVALQHTPTGSYYNLSQGAFPSPDLNASGRRKTSH